MLNTEPRTCSHGLTRSEGCAQCETVELALKFEELANGFELATAGLTDLVADYPHVDGLF